MLMILAKRNSLSHGSYTTSVRMLMRFLLMLLVLVFVGTLVSRGMLVVMSFFPCVVAMFVRMLMAVGVFMLMFVRMFAFHGMPLSA